MHISRVETRLAFKLWVQLNLACTAPHRDFDVDSVLVHAAARAHAAYFLAPAAAAAFLLVLVVVVQVKFEKAKA